MTFFPTGSRAVSQTDPGRAEQLLQWLQRTNTALSHDFCPGANRWVYWLKSPLWSLLLASGISLLCGVFLKTEALFITAILLVIAAVGVALPWLAMRGIDVHLTFDARRGRVGQAVLVRLRVRNRWPWPIWGLSLMRGFAVRYEMTPTKACRWLEFQAGPLRNTHGHSYQRFEVVTHWLHRRLKRDSPLGYTGRVERPLSMGMLSSGRRL
jgi:hypothetical protein